MTVDASPTAGSVSGGSGRGAPGGGASGGSGSGGSGSGGAGGGAVSGGAAVGGAVSGGPASGSSGGSGAAPALTERQEARRQRILRATQQLAARGGFDAVQMREVAELSEVALGTLYRYFPSKIHLLVATMQDQLEQLHDQLRRKPPVSPDPGERVAETLMRTFKALQREPHLAEAMMRALTFADRSVSAEVDSVNRLITDVIADAIHTGRTLTRTELAAVRVVTHTWHSTLITWLSGRASISQVKADIDTACTLISQAASE